MAASQDHISGTTPMGARLEADGATFRVWAPGAAHVFVAVGGADGYTPRNQDELVKDAGTGHWTGFFPGVADGEKYRFVVEGPGGSGFRRDPRARELELYGYPHCDCIVRPVDSYPWHDNAFNPPAPTELIVYREHHDPGQYCPHLRPGQRCVTSATRWWAPPGPCRVPHRYSFISSA